MPHQHTDREYQAQLNIIRDRVVAMTEKVQAMVDIAFRAYIEHDMPSIEKTSTIENEVNAIEIEIDNLCVSVLAKRQPVASDLRFLVAVLKLVPNLERIGDHAVTICKRASERANGVSLNDTMGLRAMAESLRTMLADAKKAFLDYNASLALNIIERDAVLDAHYAEIFRETLKLIEKNSANTFVAMSVQSVIKNLERMGDHVKNIAELIVYMAGGEDMRHRESLERTRQSIRGILFLCVHNSARSQIAEAFAKRIFPEGVEVFSAGSDPATSVNPLAIRTMAEIGIDISSQKPKRITSVPLDKVDAVITLCDEEICVDIPIKRSEKWNLPDPSRFTGSDDELQEKMNALRDEIRFRIESARRELFR